MREKQRYTTGDEDKQVYERTETGELRQLSAAELRGKSSEDLAKYFHLLEHGKIERVFETSASFCEELASRAFELEVSQGLPAAWSDKGERVREPIAAEPLNARPPATKGDTTRQRLGVRLKKLKMESNLTWETIAKESGVSRRWLLDVSSGRTPSATTRTIVRDYFSRVLKRRIRF